MQQYACSYSVSGRGAKARGVVTIESGNEKSLLSAVGTVGPVATYIDASHSAFQVSRRNSSLVNDLYKPILIIRAI